MYVLVRTDLPEAHRTCQAIHAALAAGAQFIPSDRFTNPHLVVLGVPDERSLTEAHEKLVRARCPVVAWLEPDMGDSLTAIATAPINGKSRRLLGRYKLLK